LESDTHKGHLSESGRGRTTRERKNKNGWRKRERKIRFSNNKERGVLVSDQTMMNG